MADCWFHIEFAGGKGNARSPFQGKALFARSRLELAVGVRKKLCLRTAGARNLDLLFDTLICIRGSCTSWVFPRDPSWFYPQKSVEN